MDPHNINDVLEALQEMGVETSAGTFVRMEDVRRMMASKQIVDAVEAEAESYKTWEEARQAAKDYLRETNGSPRPQVGRAIPASSPSAVEGVNR
jgi:hypothetical protein